MRQPMKRYSLLIPASLHKLVKVRCARDDIRMVDVIRRLLEQEFGKQNWKGPVPPKAKSKAVASGAVR